MQSESSVHVSLYWILFGVGVCLCMSPKKEDKVLHKVILKFYELYDPKLEIQKEFPC